MSTCPREPFSRNRYRNSVLPGYPATSAACLRSQAFIADQSAFRKSNNAVKARLTESSNSSASLFQSTRTRLVSAQAVIPAAFVRRMTTNGLPGGKPAWCSSDQRAVQAGFVNPPDAGMRKFVINQECEPKCVCGSLAVPDLHRASSRNLTGEYGILIYRRNGSIIKNQHNRALYR